MYPVIPALALFPFYSYTISMLSFRTGLPQYRLSLLKAQILAYFQKILDTHSFVGIITQQLSNSATQQLSNSATQQLSNSATQQLSNSGVKSVCALKNGQPFHPDNNIIIFSHQFLQMAQAVLVFLLLHTDAALLPWAYFVR